MIKLNDAKCESTIMNSGNTRVSLWKNHFYNDQKLSKLITDLKQSTIGSYISSYYIDSDFRFVEIRFRQSYLDKNKENLQFYNNDPLFEIIYNWYKAYYGEIVSMLNSQSFIDNTMQGINMYYYIAKYDNSIILNFI